MSGREDQIEGNGKPIRGLGKKSARLLPITTKGFTAGPYLYAQAAEGSSR